MGTTRDGGSQQAMVGGDGGPAPQGGGHAFYERLNQIRLSLNRCGWVEVDGRDEE